jgi:hypothetical protein
VRRLLRLGILGIVLSGAASGCVVHERPAYYGYSGCAGAVWIQAHYDRYGRWHPSHWRCPGVVEVY